jgi:hypothetical protein
MKAAAYAAGDQFNRYRPVIMLMAVLGLVAFSTGFCDDPFDPRNM